MKIASILDGRMVSAEIRQQISQTIASHSKNQSNPPGLAVILVGHNPASEIYVKNKQLACKEAGIVSECHRLPADVSPATLENLIDTLNADSKIHGILLQLPLPAHLGADYLLEKIDPKKDVDGFHPYNLGRLAQKRPLLRPCTPYGVMQLLKTIKEPLKGKNAVVVGASNIVGKPMALELLLEKCTVTICHSETRDLSEHIKIADILISATGQYGIIKSEWIKLDSIVIYVGFSRLSNNKITGDIDFDTAKLRASWITPVPGGVGPMTVAMLLQNTMQAWEWAVER